MKKLLLLAILVWQSIQVSYSNEQVSTKKVDSLGNDFILSFLRNLDKTDVEVQLHLTTPTESENGVEINIEYPVGTLYASTNIFQGNITIVSLPESASLGWSANRVQQNAVRVFSADPSTDIVVYMVNYEDHSSDAALALPLDALNTKYVVVNYLGSAGASAELVFTAAYDDTVVTMTAPFSFGGNPADTPFTVSLTRGESYYAVAETKTWSFTGSTIEATRPITLTSGVKCATIPQGVNYCDHIFEVAQPVQTWGKRFIAAPLPQRSGGSLYRIAASEDNTTALIFSDLTTEPEVINLDLGEHSQRTFSGPVLVESDKPAFMVQFMTSDANAGAIDGDPSMGNVISVDQYLREYTFSTVGNKYDVHYVSIVANAVDLGSLTLDGILVGEDRFSAVGDTDWHWAVIEIAEGPHTTKSANQGHGITVEGFEKADSYLYPGGAQFEVINQAGDTDKPECEVVEVLEVADAEDYNKMLVFQARDSGSGIFQIDVNDESSNTEVLLEVSSTFSPGDAVVNFTLTLGEVGRVEREIFAFAVDGAGNQCDFPTVGEMLPTASPSANPSSLATLEPSVVGDTESPLCSVSAVNATSGTILLQGSDNGVGVLEVSTNRRSDKVLLELDPSFSPGDTTVDFSLSLGEGANARIRDMYVIVADRAGNQCSFPTIGELLDAACIEDVECVGDPGFAFPLPNEYEHENGTSVDRMLEVLSHPSYATLEFNDSHVFYRPEWSGITYDAFAVTGQTPYGETFILTVEYGPNQTVDFSVDIIGQWEDYLLDEEFDDDTLCSDVYGDEERRVLHHDHGRRLAYNIENPEFQHEFPQSLFAPSNKNKAPKYKIEGVDKDFINQKEFGVILKMKDHRGKGSKPGAIGYNRIFENEMDTFIKANNGVMPTKNQLVNNILPKVRANKDVSAMNAKGFKANVDYGVWRGSGRGKIEKDLAKIELERMASFRATTRASSFQAREALKRAKRVGKLVPGLNSFITGASIIASLWSGESVADVFIEEAQDAIPIWGNIRGVYFLLDDLGAIDYLASMFSPEEFADYVFDSMKASSGSDSGRDQNGNAYAEVYPDPHFRMWDGSYFSYHGVCDVVYLRSHLVEIHVRLKPMKRYSTVAAVALRIGADTFEYSDDNKYYFNGTELNELPETIGGYFPLLQTSNGARIILSGGQYINIKGTSDIRVGISAHGSSFFDSAGMTGRWNKTGFSGRDWNTTFSDASSFAKEWEVNATIGDPILFRTPALHSCDQDSHFLILEPDPALRELASNACEYIEDAELRKQCTFDVVTTGDIGFASAEPYAEPWVEKSQCAASSDECTLRGGVCTWRCDTEASNCEPELCELAMSFETFAAESLSPFVVEGCSCSTPFVTPTNEPSSVPSEFPSFAPSEIPSVVPSEVPSAVPSEVPSAVPSEVPSAVPSDLPSERPSPTPTVPSQSCSSHLSSEIITVCSLLLWSLFPYLFN